MQRSRGLTRLSLERTLGPLCRRARELGTLRRALAAELAPADAAHLSGVSLDAERLTLFADSPVWCTRLRFQAAVLERATAKLIGRRVRLSFRTQPPTFRRLPPRGGLSPQAAAMLRHAARTITDPSLAAALRRLADS